MQARAVFEAAAVVQKEGIKVRPEIMIPLVAHVKELERLRALVEEEIAAVTAGRDGKRLKIAIGTMIEVPRASFVAAEIAQHADFFSFGTNDMTQMAYALSRDDAQKFLPDYMETGILEDDPFVSIDREGIGQLVRMGGERGRSTRRDLKVGICGEHGGDPKSVQFFDEVGLDYVSCSPFRVPVARLAAAQGALQAKQAKRGAKPSGKRSTAKRAAGRTAKRGARR